MNIPRATARLQFNNDFTLVDALDVVDYYADMGISHLYASRLSRKRARAPPMAMTSSTRPTSIPNSAAKRR